MDISDIQHLIEDLKKQPSIDFSRARHSYEHFNTNIYRQYEQSSSTNIVDDVFNPNYHLLWYKIMINEELGYGIKINTLGEDFLVYHTSISNENLEVLDLIKNIEPKFAQSIISLKSIFDYKDISLSYIDNSTITYEISVIMDWDKTTGLSIRRFLLYALPLPCLFEKINKKIHRRTSPVNLFFSIDNNQEIVLSSSTLKKLETVIEKPGELHRYILDGKFSEHIALIEIEHL